MTLFIGETSLAWEEPQDGLMTARIAFKGAELADVTQALAQALESVGTGGRLVVDVVLGLQWCRHLLLPWDERLVDGELAGSMAWRMFTRCFADPPEAFTLLLSQSRYRGAQVASFVPGELIAGLKRLFAVNGISHGRIEPLLSFAWRQLPCSVEDRASVFMVDESRVLRIEIETGWLTALDVRPCSHPADFPPWETAASTYVYAPEGSLSAYWSRHPVDVSRRCFDYVLYAGGQ
ncbi:hypothetical protein [Pseudomonas soli]|uniref:hypothetical protein n=1 Tax=Pseudomonas soli TaxID=1306993 RepID=UPI003810C5E0